MTLAEPCSKDGIVCFMFVPCVDDAIEDLW